MSVVLALVAACKSKACAPPPVGTGGSDTGAGSPSPVGYTEMYTAFDGAMRGLSTGDRRSIHSAVMYYTDTDNYHYEDINSILRGEREYDDGGPEMLAIEGMDLAFSNGVAPSLPHDTVLYRGMLLDSKSKVLAAMKPGAEFTDKAFVSTSASEEATEPFRKTELSSRNRVEVLLRIKAPKGTRVIPGVDDEEELILDRGTEFRVKSVEDASYMKQWLSGQDWKQEMRIVTVEVVP